MLTFTSSSQFYTALILLHRTFVNYNHVVNGQPADSSQSAHWSRMSRSVCADNAIRVTAIFEEYERSHDLSKVYVSGVQHVGTAATALMTEIFSIQDEEQRNKLLEHLLTLGRILNVLSKTYPPASLMSNVINRFVKDFSDEGSTVSASNGSEEVADEALLGQDEAMNFSGGPRVRSPMNDPGGLHGCLPYLPASWFEGMSDIRDTAFLNLMGLSELQHSLGFLDALDDPVAL